MELQSTPQSSPDRDAQSSTRHLIDASHQRGPDAAPSFDPQLVASLSNDCRSISNPLSLAIGTGYSVFKSTIIPAVLATQRELVVVTCFWAPSATRDAINDALRELSKKGVSSSYQIKVQLCFSSSSLARNLLWPTPKEGQTYEPKQWTKLGLPNPSELTGLDLKVTRKFFWPLGIVHSKYIIVDRELAIFPSCNISWERWYEVALSIKGPVVEHLLSFHSEFWENTVMRARIDPNRGNDAPEPRDLPRATDPLAPQPSVFSSDTAYTTLLPSPHTPVTLPNHLQPRSLAGQCPCVPSVSYDFPRTPLLTTTQHLINTAKSQILVLTPNFTEPTVLDALVSALERGVDVKIWTNQDLMTTEQLVTAGTTTPSYIKTLKKKYESMRGRGRWGQLQTVYFDHGIGTQQVQENDKEYIPVKLHAKVTIVDKKMILLGSCNMDAASWKTSQELGILVESKEVVQQFIKKWRYGKLGS